MSSAKLSVFEILNLRSQWEDIVGGFPIDEHRKHGTIDNIKWFVEYGLIGNRFRKGCDDAYDIAEIILKGS